MDAARTMSGSGPEPRMSSIARTKKPGRSHRSARTCGCAEYPRRWTSEDHWISTCRPRKFSITLCKPTLMEARPARRTTGCECLGGGSGCRKATL
eukprot:2845936-Heterocapsa_arctica.AAC.1